VIRAGLLVAATLLAACGNAKKQALPHNCYVGVYFEHDATRAEVDAVGRRLRGDPDAERVVFVSKAAALRIMRRRHPEATRDLPANPFPDAFRVRPKDEDGYRRIAGRLRPRPAGVDNVTYPTFGRCVRGR
jgi:cell division protein FtsX